MSSMLKFSPLCSLIMLNDLEKSKTVKPINFTQKTSADSKGKFEQYLDPPRSFKGDQKGRSNISDSDRSSSPVSTYKLEISSESFDEVSQVTSERSKLARGRPFRLMALPSSGRVGTKAQLEVLSAPALLISRDPLETDRVVLDRSSSACDHLDSFSDGLRRVERNGRSFRQHDMSANCKGGLIESARTLDKRGEKICPTNLTKSFQVSQHQELRERKSKRLDSLEDQETTGDERESRSPEPIVEIKNSSASSTSSSASLSAAPTSASEATSGSDPEEDLVSSKLIRRRTVKRQYHRRRAIREVEKETELDEGTKDSAKESKDLVVHRENAPDFNYKGYSVNSLFRTRQIGSYVNSCDQKNRSEQQQTSSTRSKTSTSTSTKHQTTSTSKCTSQSTITTNRKSTTSTQHRRQLETRTESTSPVVVEESSKSNQEEQNMITRFSPSSEPLVMSHQSGLRFEIEKAPIVEKTEQLEEQESRIAHSESHISASSRTRSAMGVCQDGALARLHQEATSNKLSSSSLSSSSRSKTLQSNGNTLKAGLSSSTSSSCSNSRQFKSSASSGVFLDGCRSELGLLGSDESKSIEMSSNHIQTRSDAFQLLTSPDMRSLAEEIVSDFAQLKSCVESASSTSSSHSSLFQQHRRGLRPIQNQLRIQNRASSPLNSGSIEEIKEILDPNVSAGYKCRLESRPNLSQASNSNSILDLLNRTQNLLQPSDRINCVRSEQPLYSCNVKGIPTSHLDVGPTWNSETQSNRLQRQRNSVMKESIERIEQRMSNLCKKLNECQDTKQAIELLQVMIQMIDEAWAVPVCGDDLGFRLCACLKASLGLDFILSLIHGAYDSRDYISTFNDETKELVRRSSKRGQLKLDLSKSGSHSSEQTKSQGIFTSNTPNDIKIAKDSDSDILTSDLGLDSVSVESLTRPTSPSTRTEDETKQSETETKESDSAVKSVENMTSEMNDDIRKEELVFLSARLLSQSLTADNRDYLVEAGWLEPVVKLACSLATYKSCPNRGKLLRALTNCTLARSKGSTEMDRETSKTGELGSSRDIELTSADCNDTKTKTEDKTFDESSNSRANISKSKTVEQQGELLANIGSEILQNLFKHSEDTCSYMISLGGLQAILYGCRSSNVETQRHCALALANLALHGGSDSQQLMIEHKAHVWLFPLAFNEDDNVQYYACLAIAILVSNQEIESDVLKSSTLNLVEPFVTSHEPRKFAESTTAHIHGQSASWLGKLIPLLDSRREEARNLAAFHFAMEAHIKREQGQTRLFKDIGAVEPLRKLGSSPIALASKFACQALRLIGEKQPHKLSQQVPLWTNDDVSEWVSQVGFEPFRLRFNESGVDGDLLLQLDEQMLERDIGIQNGIIRRRFLRELASLKRIADYSSLDKTNLCSLLGQDNIQYAYPILKFGVTRDNIHHLDGDQLLAECRIPNSIHRLLLAQSIKSLQDRLAIEAAREAANEASKENAKTLDVFVSYRRSNGSQLASLLKVHLQLRGFSVFIDVERLEAGKFDNNLLDSIKAAKNFILVLSPNALDRCIGDHECKDWVHKETVAALASDCNIIPIMDNFHWPDPDELPEDMRSIAYFNGIRWIHDYQDACVDKIERFIRGELSNTYASSIITSNASIQTSNVSQPNQNQQTAGSLAGSLQRLTCPNYASSTPSIGAPTPLGIYSARQFEADFHPLSQFVTPANQNLSQNPNPNMYLQHSTSLVNANPSGKRVN